MNLKEIAQQIIEMKDNDLSLRNQLIEKGELGNDYNKEMAELHNYNANQLNKIIDLIGFPSIDKVGPDAYDAAWLIMQHSIGQPNFMKKCQQLLEEAVKKKQANPLHLAYLSDRIAAMENRPQLYGTSFDWDENGEMSPNTYDDLLKVNERRKTLEMNTLEEQTKKIREQVKKENQFPPQDYQKRKELYDTWRKEVGWIE